MIPNAEDLLALEPEELAGILLGHLNSLGENSSSLQLYNFLLHGQSPAVAYPREYQDQINRALPWRREALFTSVQFPGAT